MGQSTIKDNLIKQRIQRHKTEGHNPLGENIDYRYYISRQQYFKKID